MITATTRFVDMPWYQDIFDLTASFSWKPYVRKIEHRRGNGVAFDTFTGSSFSSLTALAPGEFYRLDLKNLPANGLVIDNGSASMTNEPSGSTAYGYALTDDTDVFTI